MEGNAVPRTPRDPAIAAHYFERAAARDDVVGEYWLAELYCQGLGVPKDVAKAREYARSAKAAGNKDAQEWLALYEFDVKPTSSLCAGETSSSDYKSSLHYRALVLRSTIGYNISKS